MGIAHLLNIRKGADRLAADLDLDNRLFLRDLAQNVRRYAPVTLAPLLLKAAIAGQYNLA